MTRVKCRGYSLGLQRVLVDFGAEDSFARATQRVPEHYGIEVSAGAIREKTEAHATEMLMEQEEEESRLEAGGVEQIIGEIDGSLIPIVTTSEAVDKRKTRKVNWKEARLALAHAEGSVSPCFAATLDGVDQAGAKLVSCVAEAGGGRQSRIHCVGDGAPWIVDQVKEKFGSQAYYLIDFYHVSQYLAQAAIQIAGAQADRWRSEQEQLLRDSRAWQVLTHLKPHLEAPEIEDKEAPVRSCYRYLLNRLDHLDYKDAIARDLPIGSGEIESAHRYVIQKRLKLSGAWWTLDNAAALLALRVARANGRWLSYWQRCRQEAA